jgi:hypothetical protein
MSRTWCEPEAGLECQESHGLSPLSGNWWQGSVAVFATENFGHGFRHNANNCRRHKRRKLCLFSGRLKYPLLSSYKLTMVSPFWAQVARTCAFTHTRAVRSVPILRRSFVVLAPRNHGTFNLRLYSTQFFKKFQLSTRVCHGRRQPLLLSRLMLQTLLNKLMNRHVFRN